MYPFGINVILNVAKTIDKVVRIGTVFGINVILNVAKTVFPSPVIGALVWYQCYS